MSREHRNDGAVKARMPADVDTPDKVLYGLTFRQLAILAVAAVIFYGAWRALHVLLPVPVLLGAAVILGGLVFGLAVGRRDGLSMDRWLLSAVRQSRAPGALTTTDTTARTPDWVQAPRSKVMLPAPLNLPADAIDDDGEITLGGTRAAMVAVTSVNLALRTADEQAALVDTFGRWLNSLSTPTQIVVSAQPVDLPSHARKLAQAAGRLPHQSGSLPLILWAKPTPVGERVWVWLRTGLSVSDLQSRLEKIAVACWASTAQVERASDGNAAYVRLDIKRREVLTAAVGSPLVDLVDPDTPTVEPKPVEVPTALDLPDVPRTEIPMARVAPRANGTPAPTPIRKPASPAPQPVVTGAKGEDLSDWID